VIGGMSSTASAVCLALASWGFWREFGHEVQDASLQVPDAPGSRCKANATVSFEELVAKPDWAEQQETAGLAEVPDVPDTAYGAIGLTGFEELAAQPDQVEWQEIAGPAEVVEAAVPPSAAPDAAVPPSAEPDAAVPPPAEPNAAVLPSAAPDAAVPPSAEPDAAVPPPAEPNAAVLPSAAPDAAVPPSAARDGQSAGPARDAPPAGAADAGGAFFSTRAAETLASLKAKPWWVYLFLLVDVAACPILHYACRRRRQQRALGRSTSGVAKAGQLDLTAAKAEQSKICADAPMMKSAPVASPRRETEYHHIGERDQAVQVSPAGCGLCDCHCHEGVDRSVEVLPSHADDGAASGVVAAGFAEPEALVAAMAAEEEFGEPAEPAEPTAPVAAGSAEEGLDKCDAGTLSRKVLAVLFRAVAAALAEPAEVWEATEEGNTALAAKTERKESVSRSESTTADDNDSAWGQSLESGQPDERKGSGSEPRRSGSDQILAEEGRTWQEEEAPAMPLAAVTLQGQEEERTQQEEEPATPPAAVKLQGQEEGWTRQEEEAPATPPAAAELQEQEDAPSPISKPSPSLPPRTSSGRWLPPRSPSTQTCWPGCIPSLRTPPATPPRFGSWSSRTSRGSTSSA